MMYFSLAGIRGVLERCWLGSMLGSPEFVLCRSYPGLDFGESFESLVST